MASQIILTCFLLLNVIYFTQPANIDFPDIDEQGLKQRFAKRESTNTVELAFFLDKAMLDHATKNLPTDVNAEEFLAAYAYDMLNQAAIYLKGIAIELKIVEVILITEDDAFPVTKASSTYIRNFGNWLRSAEEIIGPVEDYWDHATLATGINIEGKEGSAGNTGKGFKGGICTKSSLTLVEVIRMRRAITIAHELGHSLGMEHDGKVKDGEAINNCPKRGFIMGQGTKLEPKMKWSSCSADYLKNHLLKLKKKNCLIKSAKKTLKDIDTVFKGKALSQVKLPGQTFDANVQCAFEFGKQFESADGTKDTGSSKVITAESKCQTLRCIDKEANIIKTTAPAFDGTSCDEEGEKICINKKCVKK